MEAYPAPQIVIVAPDAGAARIELAAKLGRPVLGPGVSLRRTPSNGDPGDADGVEHDQSLEPWLALTASGQRLDLVCLVDMADEESLPAVIAGLHAGLSEGGILCGAERSAEALRKLMGRSTEFAAGAALTFVVEDAEWKAVIRPFWSA